MAYPILEAAQKFAINLHPIITIAQKDILTILTNGNAVDPTIVFKEPSFLSGDENAKKIIGIGILHLIGTLEDTRDVTPTPTTQTTQTTAIILYLILTFGIDVKDSMITQYSSISNDNGDILHKYMPEASRMLHILFLADQIHFPITARNNSAYMDYRYPEKNFWSLLKDLIHDAGDDITDDPIPILAQIAGISYECAEKIYDKTLLLERSVAQKLLQKYGITNQEILDSFTDTFFTTVS